MESLILFSLFPLCVRLLYLVLLAGGTILMAAMLTPDVQHNLQSAFKGNIYILKLHRFFSRNKRTRGRL